MKTTYSITALTLLLLLTGCTTSSQVQEMIDASRRDYLDQVAGHEASIDVLKQSSMAALEQGNANEAALEELRQEIKSMLATLDLIQRNTEAAKLMSAANAVKVAGIEDVVTTNKEDFDKFQKKMETVGRLYQEVMIAHYKALLESAAAAIQALKVDNENTAKTAPVSLDQPIEIVAPDTTVAVSNAPAQ